MSEIGRPRTFFQGHTYHKLSREFQRYRKNPMDVSPLELFEWAVDIGGWSLHENDYNPSLAWWGPFGNPPVIGSEISRFPDRNVALLNMRAQYSIWWNQKEEVEEAFRLLRASEQPHECSGCPNCQEEQEDEPETF